MTNTHRIPTHLTNSSKNPKSPVAAGLSMGRRLQLVLVVALLYPAPVASQAAAACTAPQHRAFDFWLGDWDVFRPDGTKAGENTIVSTQGGCVLHETYRAGGYEGQSLNVYDGSRGVWHQTWVDNGGLLLRLEGGYQGDAMVLQGETVSLGGTTLQRITWSRIDGGPNVRQHWETSSDGGTTWATAFDGTYVPRTPSGDSNDGIEPRSSTER